MFGFFKKKDEVAPDPASKEVILYAVADGDLVNIESVNDVVFSQKMMGDGFAVVPDNGMIVTPVEGKIVNVFPTKHAIGLEVNGLEVLLHMGIDTVALNGEPFETKVSDGQRLGAGTQVSQVDLNKLADAGKDNAMIVIFTNGNDLIESFELTASGHVSKGQVIGKIQLK